MLLVVGGFPVIFGQEGENNINEKSNDSRTRGRRMTACGNNLDRRLGVVILQGKSQLG